MNSDGEDDVTGGGGEHEGEERGKIEAEGKRR